MRAQSRYMSAMAAVLEVLLAEALDRTPLGEAHAHWSDTLLQLGRLPEAVAALESWLPTSRGVARCELLCALARTRAAAGLSVAALLSEAHALAEAEWADAERAWSALGAAHHAAGDLDAALVAWTHEDNPYRFDCRAPIAAMAVSLRRAGRWSALDVLLRHVGPGHEQAVILDAVIDDALARRELGPALQALWWIPESLREGALLRAIGGMVSAGRLEDGWAAEALWDGIEGGHASRARARVMLGDAADGRALLAPLLVAWLSPARPPRDTDALHAAVALLLLDDVDGAAWCLGRIPGQRAALRALEACASAAPSAALLASVLARWPGDPTVMRVVGSLEAAGGQAAAGRARLQQAADAAAALEDFYPRRLALQEIAHAQIAAGDIEGALHTAERLTRERFGHEHIAAAAVRLAGAGALDEAAALLARLPPGALRIQAGCAALRALQQGAVSFGERKQNVK